MAKISILGLGYVGTVSAACLANEGHRVIGVDPNETKVGLINEGKSPIIEEGIAELVEKMVSAGNLSATIDPAKGIKESEISMICVGTPSQLNGSLDLKYVHRVCQEIGEALKSKNEFHVVTCRSTILPLPLQ